MLRSNSKVVAPKPTTALVRRASESPPSPGMTENREDDISYVSGQ